MPEQTHLKPPKSAKSILMRSETIVVILLMTFFILFSRISAGFFSSSMLNVIFLTGSELGIIALGVTLLIISGEMDLSVASVFVFSNYIVLISNQFGLPILVSFILGIIFGIGAGFLNGFFTMKFKIPSFVVTLGFMIFWRAVLAGLTNGEPTYYEGVPTRLFKVLGGQIGFIPNQFIWFCILAVVFSIVLNRTKFGNWIMATGGSIQTARALGVNIFRIKMICFMISSSLAAFAGASFLVRSSYLDPIVATGMELEAVAAAVIGGTVLTGGIGSIIGTSICAFLLKVVQVGIATYGIRVEYYNVLVGILLMIAAVINSALIKKLLKT